MLNTIHMHIILTDLYTVVLPILQKGIPFKLLKNPVLSAKYSGVCAEKEVRCFTFRLCTKVSMIQMVNHNTEYRKGDQ